MREDCEHVPLTVDAKQNLNRNGFERLHGIHQRFQLVHVHAHLIGANQNGFLVSFGEHASRGEHVFQFLFHRDTPRWYSGA